MDKIQEFKNHYKKEILPYIPSLNKKRKRINLLLNSYKFIYIVWVITLISVFAYFFYNYKEYRFYFSLFLIVPALLTLVSYSPRIDSIKKKMRPQFKKNVVSKIINNFDKEATYEGSEFISREDFENSGLFKKIGKYTRHKYSGEDFVRMHVYDKNGKNATEITFSELHVRLGVEETYNRRRKKDFFWGMFYKIKFNKSFNSELYLNSYKRKNMDLEDYDFNKIFSAHTNDQVEARYILSTSFMERLKEFKKLLGDDVKLRVSFIDNIMYVAVNSGKDFFEPKANKDLSDFNNILPYYLEIEYLVEIVEILNLNLRIWN